MGVRREAIADAIHLDAAGLSEQAGFADKLEHIRLRLQHILRLRGSSTPPETLEFRVGM